MYFLFIWNLITGLQQGAESWHLDKERMASSNSRESDAVPLSKLNLDNHWPKSFAARQPSSGPQMQKNAPRTTTEHSCLPKIRCCMMIFLFVFKINLKWVPLLIFVICFIGLTTGTVRGPVEGYVVLQQPIAVPSCHWFVGVWRFCQTCWCRHVPITRQNCCRHPQRCCNFFLKTYKSRE